MMQRKRRMDTSKDTFATFWNDKETGAETCPAIVSVIVTEEALVSYWPMLLAIITICTCAQLHSNTISGFACVASVQFLSKESKTARTPPPPPPFILIFGSRSTFRAATFLVIPRSSLLRNHTETLATQSISGCNYFLRYTVLACR